ncbi:MAG TPA: alpha/beta hydrolase [Tepidisphaeraceae bacterium]|nr:alpha/beta hydrolase [Tepidisphaeraceae bacterium]
MKHSFLITALLFFASIVQAADPANTRTQDVIYGRLPGVALTMDVFTPKSNSNHIGVIAMVSGGWASSHEAIDNPFFSVFMNVLTQRGYTVFAVVHGSQPKYTIPEILSMTSRAVRFIRFHAADYHIDPNRLGVTGGSAGGHLSLMQGCDPVPPNPKSADPVDRVSASVQAVGCFFPPTDFLNYGAPGVIGLGRGALSWLKAPFDFHELNPKTNSYDVITDEAKILAIGKQISPIYFVTSHSPPTLIIHGDADKLVPLEQSQAMIDALTKAGVPCKLIVKPGAGHGWLGADKDVQTIADWFDQYLKNPPATKPAQQ